jgi:4-hydroxybenzoate polyprenyltransferase
MTKSEAGERSTFKRIVWIVAICFGSLLAIYAFGYFRWFKDNEYVALWLEGVALVFIFGLDYVNRLDDTEEHAKQHIETLTQLELLRNQAGACQRP